MHTVAWPSALAKLTAVGYGVRSYIKRMLEAKFKDPPEVLHVIAN